jgi:hypothetical protein
LHNNLITEELSLYRKILRKFRTSLLTAGDLIDCTAKDATQTDLEGEQFYNSRVVALVNSNINIMRRYFIP